MKVIGRAGLLAASMLFLGAGFVWQMRSVSGGNRGASAVNDQLVSNLAVTRQGRFYFYHHSVGANVLAGIAQLDAESGGGLRLTSREQAGTIDGPVLAHGGGGRNGDPKGKLNVFAAVIRSDAGLRPDVALMKLCYTDINPRTDVDDLFTYYKTTMESLKREHPGVRFAHVTVPLMAWPTSLKARLKRFLGREVWEDAGNVKRADFNKRLIEAFHSDPVFDLARLEATAPDGTITTFREGGKSYPSLHPGYTDDGGHLNPTAQRLAGAATIRFLADSLKGRRSAR